MPDLTPERLAELRRIAEAGPTGEWDMIELEHSTVLALLDEIERLRNVAIDPGEYGIDEPVVDWKRTAELRAQEIERLRRERETLAAAVMAWEEYRNAALGSIAEVEAVAKLRETHTKALALLDGEGGGGA